MLDRKREALPRTLEEAIAKGFEIIEEKWQGGELNRRGHFILQRVDKPTGRLRIPHRTLYRET